MTKPLSDAQLVYASNHNLINSHNGKTCRRVTAKGVCGGRVILTNGVLTYHNTCGQVCPYTSSSAPELQQEIDRLIHYAGVIDKIRSGCNE